MPPARKDASDLKQDTLSKAIGAEMRRIRVDGNWTIKEVTDRMAAYRKDPYIVSPAGYRHWENGTRPMPLSALGTIAKALRVKVHDLIPDGW